MFDIFGAVFGLCNFFFLALTFLPSSEYRLAWRDKFLINMVSSIGIASNFLYLVNSIITLVKKG